MRILLAVDGSVYTQKMLDYLAAHAPWLASADNSYAALTVQPPLPPRAAKALGKHLVDEYYTDEAQKVLEPVRQFLEQHHANAQCTAKVGHIAETIAATADDGYDLLIMGTRGYGVLGKLVMGSVATQVLAQSKVPVLLIR